jgi:hypothetical protein
MASYDTQHSKAGFSSLEQRADRQMAHYWRVRITTTLDRLEREARRMFQLESELSHFARDYYDAVGEAVERLASLEQLTAADSRDSDVPHAMPAVMAQRDAHGTRQVELKARYRSLAKEIHPDRAMAVEGAGQNANNMHTLNAAYQHGDLAALLKLEAQMLLEQLMSSDNTVNMQFEAALRDVQRAADTYAEGYRTMLGSPLNELMLRAMSARLAGWDWVQAVVRKIERAIEEKERAAIEAGIAQISAWRETAYATDAAA